MQSAGPRLISSSGSGDAHARALDLLHEARDRERTGCMTEAAEGYTEAIALAEHHRELRVLAEALRRLAVLRFHRSSPDEARELCRRSYTVACEVGDDVLAAEALNTLATVNLQTGELDTAHETYERALVLGGNDRELRARVEQNLGVLANIHGDLHKAQHHYRSSLEAYESTRNEEGCAIAYHNLGMVSADWELWVEAQENFRRSLTIAERLGDVHLEALCRLNNSEVDLALERHDDARRGAEAALCLFDQLGAGAPKAEAYRVLGMVYRETGKLALAESRFRCSLDLAASTGSVLGQAESARELAVLYQTMGRNQEALTLLHQSWRLFKRLDARVDLINVHRKVADLESTYLSLVREWGQSIESSDSYTHGHCERVATYAVEVGKALELDRTELSTLRVGAYLHDVGKVRVPHEILNKPGRLTADEFDIVKQHTIWGVELLASVEFPWDIKPIIRWHHEKADGTGYPDRLVGEEIPISAQIIGIVDVFDALTTNRAYREAMSHDEALAEIRNCRHWWRADVAEAFFAAVRSQRFEREVAAAA